MIVYILRILNSTNILGVYSTFEKATKEWHSYLSKLTSNSKDIIGDIVGDTVDNDIVLTENIKGEIISIKLDSVSMSLCV